MNGCTVSYPEEKQFRVWLDNNQEVKDFPNEALEIIVKTFSKKEIGRGVIYTLQRNCVKECIDKKYFNLDQEADARRRLATVLNRMDAFRAKL